MLWVVAVLRKILDKFLAPSRWLHFPLNIIATVVALLYSESILVRNQTNEVYPPESDSIGIPLMGMAFYSVLSLVLLPVGMALVRRGTFARWSGHLLIFLLALGYLVQIAAEELAEGSAHVDDGHDRGYRVIWPTGEDAVPAARAQRRGAA